MHNILVSWCLAIMAVLVPKAPWTDSYPREAEAFVTAAERDPLFKGPRGVERTIDYELSVASFESVFDPSAKGDRGASLGLFQITPATAKPYQGQAHALRAVWGDTFDPWRPVSEELLEPEGAAPLAIRLMRVSFWICRDRPRDERLGWYAAGGFGCRGVRESKHRVNRALWIARAFPAPLEVEPKGDSSQS